MKLNSKLTGGLAWAGLVVVLAVPSADLLTGKKDGDSAKAVTPLMTSSSTDAIQTATVETTKAPSPQPTIKRSVQTAAQDPVESYVSSGKKLPSYISDAPADSASTKQVETPKLVVPSSTTNTTTLQPVEDTQVAALPKDEEAPIPYPASMRPAAKTEVASTTVVTAPTTPVKTTTIVAPQTGITPDSTATTTSTNVASTAPVNGADEQPLIIDEDVVQRRDEAVAKVLDDEPQVAATQEPRRIEGDQLEEWDSGSLADYLERMPDSVVYGVRRTKDPR